MVESTPNCIQTDLISFFSQFSEKSVIGHMQSLINENSDIDDDTAKECFTNLILAGIYTFISKMSL